MINFLVILVLLRIMIFFLLFKSSFGGSMDVYIASEVQSLYMLKFRTSNARNVKFWTYVSTWCCTFFLKCFTIGHGFLYRNHGSEILRIFVSCLVAKTKN